MIRRFSGFWMVAAVVLSATLTAQNPQPRRQSPQPVQPGGAKKHLALVGGMLIDGYDVPPVHRAAILIEDNKIVDAGPASEVKIPSDATIIDTSGRVMMPGLIEEHAHLSILGHGDYNRWYPWIVQNGYMEKVMEISAKQLLMAGITTAVDLGGPLKESLSVRDRIKKGEIPGPHMLVSGPWVTRALGNYPAEMNIMQRLINTPEEAAQATEELIASGVDVIKAYVQLTPAHYKAITDAAHKHRIRVHAHVYAEQDVRNALENGVDVLTHVGSAGTAPPYSKKMIEDIVNAGRPVVVTGAHRSWVFPDTVAFPERLVDPQLKADFAPIPPLWDEVQHSLKNFQGLGYFARTDREMFFRERGVKQFIESGAIMGMGTDSGTPMNFHTEALWREIKAHVDMGMSPQRAIMATTRVNARSVLGLPDRGTIEPGKLADIIVVNGNPLYDIVALSHVEVVVKDGVVYKGAAAAKPARSSSAGQ
jgi:imidazolonepropionase-like amidohydrolase